MEHSEFKEWYPNYENDFADQGKDRELECFYVMDPAGWIYFSNGCYTEPGRYRY